jgi:hypothetical protein
MGPMSKMRRPPRLAYSVFARAAARLTRGGEGNRRRPRDWARAPPGPPLCFPVFPTSLYTVTSGRAVSTSSQFSATSSSSST